MPLDSNASERFADFCPREDDVARVRAALRAAIPSSVVRLAATDRLRPLTGAAWSLEWNLARWIGSGFHLKPATQERLVVASALGLLSLKIEDDLADGEIEPGSIPPGLAERLLATAEDQLRLEIPGSSPFWSAYRAVLASWRNHHGRSDLGQPRSDDPLRAPLSEAGSPLYLVGQAICLLADRSDQTQWVQSVLYNYLSASVLLDHLKDWPGDLAAGRSNHFLKHVSPTSVSPTIAQSAASAWSAIAAGESYVSYLAAIDGYLTQAIRSSHLLRAPLLQEYLTALQQDLTESAGRARSTAASTFAELQSRILA